MVRPRSPRRAVLSRAADHDIRDLIRWSRQNFGIAASARYRVLLVQAIRDLEADPMRAGTNAVPGLPEGARTYHLAFSRDKVASPRVKQPRHFIVYRTTLTRIEIARVLHDSRDLMSHLPHDWVT